MQRLQALARLAVGALSVAGAAIVGGCVEDADCGVCDPDNLILESMTALNYAGNNVNILNPRCEGANCPDPIEEGRYFIERIGPCEETEDAMESDRGAEEYCRIAPIASAFGIEFVFNNLLEATSVELVRKRPDNPDLFEVYDWKTQVLEIQGPITRYNGDYHTGIGDEPDTVTRLVNLSCIENLKPEVFDHTDLDDPASNPCNQIDPITGTPRKMRMDGVVTAARGKWDVRAVAGGSGSSCDNPEDGPDTCCSQCDFLLGTGVAKYGLTSNPGGDLDRLGRTEIQALLAKPGAGAIECDATTPGDKFAQCAGFVPWVDRTQETREYAFFWSNEEVRDDFRLPYYDKLRQTHPDARPPWLERRTAQCVSDAECAGLHGLPGSECVGSLGSGGACSPELGDPGCTLGRCIAPWFVDCVASPDTTGPTGYCVDTRFDGRGAMACFQADRNFEVCDPQTGACQTAPVDTKVSVCDINDDRRYDAAECCGVSGLENCDPAVQDFMRPLARYERNSNLPSGTRGCICGTASDACDGVENLAAVCGYDGDGAIPEGGGPRNGEYAVKFVTRRGGVIYDPAIKGIEWRPADVGSVPRAAAEVCAAQRGLISGRSIEDGWRAHDAFDTATERFEDFDRGMCSGQEYTVLFETDPDGEVLEDKVGNTLEGKATYTFETPQFHVIPGSGFPTDNLRIGACDEFSLRFSNKYDMSPENLAKIVLRPVGATEPVAGGTGCAPTKDDPGVPCLSIDVANQISGEVTVFIDPAEFGGDILDEGATYELVAPGLASVADAQDPALYTTAFWDVCGMPLVLGNGEQTANSIHTFTIDEPKCKEDQDRDGIQFSCDNARDHFNPLQGDTDRDGVGDVVDLCPTVVTSINNSADSDRDGVGNECDVCRRTSDQYNSDAAALGIVGSMLVRNVPLQDDTDGDGIGDVCDNCVTVANCQAYGPGNEWEVGSPIAFDDENVCQRDDDSNMVGDACEGLMADGAAGPVGFGEIDDFDQDGLVNRSDACPRQPLTDRIECMTGEDCPAGRGCDRVEPTDPLGVCDHLDSDGDDVGDLCDTCPAISNPMQVVDGSAQEDDADGDFVGRDCESSAGCEDRRDPKPFGFYEVSSLGLCCTTQLVETPDGLVNATTGDPLVDPDGVPVRLDCVEDTNGDGMPDGVCRRLPDPVRERPGVVSQPAGCTEALADAGYTSPEQNVRLTEADVGGDLVALWDAMCFLPQFDQDFDGVGDICDLCQFDFDPSNLPYIDDNGKLWPQDGKFCNGIYSIDTRCAAVDPPEPTGTGSGSDDGSGDGTGGGSGTTGS